MPVILEVPETTTVTRKPDSATVNLDLMADNVMSKLIQNNVFDRNVDFLASLLPRIIIKVKSL